MTTAVADVAPSRATPATLPGRGVRFAHLFVLSGLAVAQPLFDVLGAAPGFFISHGSTAADIVLLTAAALLLVPAALFALELLAEAAGRRAARIAHLVAVAILAGVLALQALKRLDASTDALVIAAQAIGFAGAVVYSRVAAARLFLTVLLPAPLVFAAVFLHRSPAWELAFADPPIPPPATAAKRMPPIVLVVFDEFPVMSLLDARDRIDEIRYPNFARLAREGIWYRNATTVADETLDAVPSLLTGTLGEGGALPVYVDHPRNLFALLPAEYRVERLEPLTDLCPPARCETDSSSATRRLAELGSDAGLVLLHTGLPRDAAARLPAVTDGWLRFRDGLDDRELTEATFARARGDRVRPGSRAHDEDVEVLAGLFGESYRSDPRAWWSEFLSRLRPSRRPTLHFLHVLLPHVPWRLVPSGRAYDAPRTEAYYNDDWLTGPDGVRGAQQRHLVQMRAVDGLVGRLLDRLRATGLYDRSLLVLTADHGSSFQADAPRRSVSRANLAEIAFVPLFVKLPNQRRGGIVDRHVRTIDVLPTIADVLGIDTSWPMAGRSVLDAGTSARAVRVTSHLGGRESAPTGDVRRERARLLAAQVAGFGAGDSPRLYMGNTPLAFGRRIASGGRAADLRVDLDADSFAFDPAGSVAPALVAGTLGGTGARETPLDLAIALNGRIVARTRAFELDGAVRFESLMPESELRRGANRVTLYRERPGGRLERIPRRG